MRSIKTLLLVAILASGAWWLWNHHQHISDFIEEYLGEGEVLTLEARYTADQIMDAHKKDLLIDEQHTFHESSLKFYPYLLMEVKYSQQDKKTREGIILWGLENGEMVINTENWETTHGFEDCIAANANRNDFKVINAIAKHNGAMRIEELQQELQVEPDTLDDWLESASDKHLIVQKGSLCTLHFQNPKLYVVPQTKINQWLVTKPYSHATKISKKYSKSQIEKIAKAAFGSDFTIRNTKEIFFPVLTIEILNPDGSVLTSYWNALNGQRIHPKYLAYNN